MPYPARTEPHDDGQSHRRRDRSAPLSQQRLIIILALVGISVLLIVGFVLLRTNQKRKTANAKLRDTNHQLKELNRTVRSQKEELERLNNIKTKLFAIIAHDLRGPLGSLQSLLYLLLALKVLIMNQSYQ